MIAYFIDRTSLEIKDSVTISEYKLKLDEETNSSSSIVIHKKPNANQNDFVIIKEKENNIYQGIIKELQGEKDSNQVECILDHISNLFDRKVYVDGMSYMETSLEDFLYYNINKFFKQGDNDTRIAMSYLEIIQSTQTSVTEPTNAENNIYNFHTFMTNCRQNKNISVDFNVTQEKITVTIANIGNQNTIKIDTTNNDVVNYNKVYEVDITSRVTVYCGDTGNILNYYLLTDRTISTNKNAVNRADGVLETIYVDEESKALEQATNVFKGNTYNHLVEFEIKKDSKLVNVNELTIGRPIQIKTKDGILSSYISSKEIEDSSEFIKFKSGKIRVDLIDKLKQEPYKIGINKVDKATFDKIYSNENNKTILMPDYLYTKGWYKTLPAGNGLSNAYWCSLPNGWYYHNANDNVTNMPYTYGFVQKTGVYTTDGTTGELNVLFYEQRTGAIYRASGNHSNSTLFGWYAIRQEKILYDNSSGTTGTVTLNETFSNFKYIEVTIGFIVPNGMQKVVRVYNTGSSVEFQNAFNSYDGNMNVYYRSYVVSGTSITIGQSYMWASNGYVGVYNGHYIIKVIGYR